MPRPRSGLRVIAGSAKGRRLDTPPGLGTRPVTDRVKESLFGHLGPVLEGARVLDLYAGSGALAIEALSRGAVSAVLVEHDPIAASLIERNLAQTGLADHATAVRADALAHLRRGPPEAFDLVFLDPPYEALTAEVEEALTVLADGWLAAHATVVIRRRAGDQPRLPPGLEFTRVKKYGDTLVLVAAAT